MNTKKIMLFLILCLFSISLISCSSGGIFNEGNMTDVKLGSANYNIVATDVSGQSKSAYVLGFIGSNGMSTSIYAVARVNGTKQLYADAINNLWKNFQKKNGDIVGRKYALVNVRYDANALNLFFYCSIIVTVRADIIEFVDNQDQK